MSKKSVEDNKQDSKEILKLNEISNLLNYDFKNIKYLKEALTRQSAITEGHQNAYKNNYQRLEFLGDSVLNFIISDLVYDIFPDNKEEGLSFLRSILIRNDTLGTFADKINLGKFLIVGKGEEFSNIRHNKKVLADLVESLFGAVFIDSEKNYDVTKYVVLNFLKPVIYGDKNFIKYSFNLDQYFNKLKVLEREVLPELSEVVDLNNQSYVLSENSFSEFLNSNKTREETNFNNQNVDMKDFTNNNSNTTIIIDNSGKSIIKLKNNPDNYFKIFSNIRFEISDVENLLSMTDKLEDLNNSLDKISQEINFNHLIDFELLYINSNENFTGLLVKNIQATEKLIKAICMKIIYYLNNLEIKQHYFYSKLLLYLIINFNNEINDFLFKSVFCLLHNGICEYYRKNYEMSKQFLEKVFESLKIIEEDNNSNSTNNNNTKIILDYKFTCVNYYAEIAFINNNIGLMNECVKIISSLNQNFDDSWKIVQFQKIYVKNFILINSNDLNSVNDVIQKFSYQLNSLSDEIKSSKAFLEDFIELGLLKFKLNKFLDFSEIYEFQKLIEDRCGENSILLYNIFSFYLNRLKEEYNSPNANLNFEIFERIALYSNRLMKIILKNFTMNTQIFIEHLKDYNITLDKYANFTSL